MLFVGRKGETSLHGYKANKGERPLGIHDNIL